MKSHVAIYKTHDEAMRAVKALNASGFPMDHVSLIGKADIIDENIKVKSLELLKMAPFFLFISVGIVLGLLAGLGLVNISGFEFMKDTSQVINAFLGFTFGLLSGAIVTIALSLVFKNDNVIRYKQHLVEKKFLVIVNGSLDEIESAEQILHTEGAHLKAA